MAATMGNQRRGSLSYPNVKLLSYNLKTANRSSVKHGRQLWACKYNDKPTEFAYAWVQGTVMSVNLENEQVIIKDETGKILLSAVRMVLGSVEDPYVLESGQYVMAIGELKDNKSDLPEIRVQKLKIQEEGKQELSSLWSLEVQHQLKYATITM